MHFFFFFQNVSLSLGTELPIPQLLFFLDEKFTNWATGLKIDSTKYLLGQEIVVLFLCTRGNYNYISFIDEKCSRSELAIFLFLSKEVVGQFFTLVFNFVRDNVISKFCKRVLVVQAEVDGGVDVVQDVAGLDGGGADVLVDDSTFESSDDQNPETQNGNGHQKPFYCR